jgi:mono/diheme cytochrome c family protein
MIHAPTPSADLKSNSYQQHRIFLIALTLTLLPVLRSQTAAEIEASFKQLDRDENGKVTRQESDNAKWFDRGDENQDGELTLEEAVRRLSAGVEKHESPGPEVPPPDDSLKEQPQVLKAADHGVGRRVPEFVVKDLARQAVKPLAGSKATVVVCFGASCPISRKFGPEMARLEAEYGRKNIEFVFLSPLDGVESGDLREFVATYALKSPVISGATGGLTSALRPTTTTEVFVLDAARTLVFRGALNDQYGLGYSKPAATRHYLRDALDAVLRGERPPIEATTAPGCALELEESLPVTATTPTYHREISRIMQAHCVECHREGGLGPFSLESLKDLEEHAGMIRKQVERGAMPPWFAAPGVHGIFSNDRSLPEADKTALLAWLQSGRPLGDPAEAPLPRTFPEGWSMGTPDVVFQIPEPVAIQAEGTMPYQDRVVETSLTEERWVQGYEILPTAPEVVHHVIVKVHPKDSSLRRRDEGEEEFFAAYVPGNSHRMLTPGYAKRLPAGSRLSFQIHYTPNGKATTDQVKIGLIFAKELPRHEVHVAAVVQPQLKIPPGEANHVETKRQIIPVNMNITAFMAHMHVRGKSFKYELTTPDGRTETLLDIPRYDFNWQLQYDYAQPKFIPRGSTMTITAVFDNSSGNPANPDPTKTVRWGDQTYDEMMIGYVEHHRPLP